MFNREELQNMTTEELDHLREKWYADATLKGHRWIFVRIAKELGNPIDTDNDRYEWMDGDFKIQWHEQRRHISVTYKSKVVFDSDVQLFIPGKWINKLDEPHKKALAAEQERLRAQMEEHRQYLIDLLTLPEEDEENKS